MLWRSFCFFTVRAETRLRDNHSIRRRVSLKGQIATLDFKAWWISDVSKEGFLNRWFTYAGVSRNPSCLFLIPHVMQVLYVDRWWIITCVRAHTKCSSLSLEKQQRWTRLWSKRRQYVWLLFCYLKLSRDANLQFKGCTCNEWCNTVTRLKSLPLKETENTTN